MRRTRAHALYLVLLGLSIAALAWPLFVLSGTLLGLWSGEARQLDLWTLEPKRRLLAAFLEGWRESLPVAALLGFVAVVDHALLSRYRVTWIVGGVLLPAVTAALALVFYRDAPTALPTLVATGVALALLHRLGEWGRRALSGE